MKITYDQKHNVAYIQFREKCEVETVKVSDEVNIDLFPDGKIHGLELLNANEQLQINQAGEIIFNNGVTSEIVKLPIAV